MDLSASIYSYADKSLWAGSYSLCGLFNPGSYPMPELWHLQSPHQLARKGVGWGVMAAKQPLMRFSYLW